MNDRLDMLARMMAGDDDEPEKFTVLPEARAMDLRSKLKELNNIDKFEVGDMVMWKPGFDYMKRPLDGEPAVITRILDEPVFDRHQSSGTALFQMPLTIVIGFPEDDGTFMEYAVDGRRFHKVDL